LTVIVSGKECLGSRRDTLSTCLIHAFDISDRVILKGLTTLKTLRAGTVPLPCLCPQNVADLKNFMTLDTTYAPLPIDIRGGMTS
jgi:hypothetical protein